MKIRLNKFISQAGICSRRKADELIALGKIKVNHKVVKELGIMVDVDQDEVFYNNQKEGDPSRGRPLKLGQKKEYVVLNKPVGYVCTHRQFRGEKNIFELLPKEYKRLACVGRLDKNSRGLVLLTNDGELAQKLSHPSSGHEKEYIVQIDKEISDREIRKLEKGFKIDGLGFVKMRSVERTEPPGSRYLLPGGSVFLRVILTQGKKRQIRENVGVFGRGGS